MNEWFTKFARTASNVTGSRSIFLCGALDSCVGNYWPPSFIIRTPGNWLSTLATIITFLMVFLIQSAQNRDAKAIHLKIDEIILASKALAIRWSILPISQAIRGTGERIQTDLRFELISGGFYGRFL
jgi:low affinity Fe/Cu permease